MIKLTEKDKEWARRIFLDNQQYLCSDFEEAWEEGIFYGIENVGFIRIKLDKVNVICELAVDKDHRRKGVAEQLLCYAIYPCLVATHADNLPAIKLYEKNGFLHQGEALDKFGKLLNIYKKG